MKTGIDAKRCSCNIVLDNLINGLAEKNRRERYLSNVSTAEKFLNSQSPVSIQEIADCDCDAGLAIKEIKNALRIGDSKEEVARTRKAFSILTFPIKMKIEQKIKSIFRNR